MIITRLRSTANPQTVAVALQNLDAQKQTTYNRFAVLSTKDAQGGEHAFLLQADSKTDKDLKLLETAGADKLVTFAVKQGDLEHTVTGKITGYAAPKRNWQFAGSIAALGGGVGACFLGFAAALNGIDGVAHLGTMGPTFVGILGLMSMIGGGNSVGSAIKKNDGVDWAAQCVRDSLEQGSAQATVKGVETQQKPVAALPAPSEQAFVLPPALLTQTEKVLVER